MKLLIGFFFFFFTHFDDRLEVEVLTFHGDAAFHGIAMANEEQGFWFSIRRKPPAGEKLQASRIQNEPLKNRVIGNFER